MSVRTEKAVFAAGCFWGIEEAFRRVPGVVKTTAGYTGGWTKNPTYEEVCTNRTGHAESVLVEYDPRKVTYGKLLEVFWRIHDPTALNRQGPDIGAQYRSAIFYADDAQKKAALASKEALGRSGTFAKPIVTEIAPLGAFYPAEEYHQGYYRKNGPGSCHVPGL